MIERTEVSNRLKILSQSEVADLYRLPIFTPEQRVLYFTLDDLELEEMQTRYRIGSRIDFILQLGYFKYRPIFFKFTFKEVEEDINFIVKKYFPKATIPKVRVSPKTKWKNQSDILKFLQFKMFDQSTQHMLEDIAQKTMIACSNARYVFDALLHYLEAQHMTLPGYSTLQKIISKAFVIEERRLAKIIENNIPHYVDGTFRQLLKNEEDTYGITIFKTDAKGFKNADVKAEINKKISSESLYNFAAKILPKLKISRDNILYYASLVDYYSVDKLRELSYDNVRLYLLCYSFYRFQKTNDNLVHAFVYYVSSYQKKAKEVGKQDVYEYKSLKSDYFEKTLELIDLFVDKSIKGMTLFEKVREKAFDIVKEEEFPALKQGLKGHVIDEKKFSWDHYPKIAGLITRNLRPLARTINFEGDKPNDDLIIALEFLKKTFDTKKSLKKINQADFPTAFIPSNRQSYLYDRDEKDPSIKTINVHKYEFLVYERLEAELSSGRIIVNESTSFKSFSRDLTLIKTEEQRKNLLSDLNNPMLSTPIKIQLQEFKNMLNPLILKVNEEIASGKNKAIKFKKNGTWSIPYSGQKDEINNPFYGQFSQSSLINVLHFANEQCNFINFFPHIRPRYAKGEADEDGIYACLIALATNHGIFQISKISDLNYNKLHSIFKNNIRLENLKNAADIVSDKIAELPMFKRWNLMDNLLFASLDGKKRQAKRQNIISRFSPKYFGRKRGVVCYSMIANNVCVNAKILGANEHESHYLFDSIQNNSTTISADYICGDDHSINSINFALCRLISSKFGPHLKNLYQKSQNIFCFGNPEAYKEELLVPEGRINSKLIEDEWENIQHIFISLLTKETTQSIVVKKLSSYQRRNKTQAALWEFDKIFKSLHILNFIQDPVLRQCIRIALNRGEGIHQLTGALGGIGGGKFKGNTELELQIANECLRLVTNCIIYYNTAILSKIYETQEKTGNTKALEFIKRLSPIAWRHINLGGNYEFTNQLETLNIDAMIANLDFNVVMK